MIKAQIIADSKNTWGHRITTFVLTFPRIILAELNTHRMFSRNSASSRAIPFAKMLERISNDPFIPIAWQKDHSGMQGTEYFKEDERFDGGGRLIVDYLREIWLESRDSVVEKAKMLSDFGVFNSNIKGLTKQIVNRPLEAFMWHTAIITATDFENFFHLRCPQYQLYDGSPQGDLPIIFRSRKDAIKTFPDLQDSGIHSRKMSNMDWLLANKGQGEIHIMALAEAMWDAYNENIPDALQPGEWHIPFGDQINFEDQSIIWQHVHNVLIANTPAESVKIKIATARCARVSYSNFDGTNDYGKDIELHDRLAASGHWSPFEHCARSMSEKELDDNILIQNGLTTPGVSGNFKGFMQYRKLFPNENKEIYVPVT